MRSLKQNASRQPDDALRADGQSHEISIVAGKPEFLPDYSEPEANLFVWSYIVRFANMSERPVELLGRKWLVRDGLNRTQDVLAASVGGGDRPLLPPGGCYTYSSGLPLPTANGIMTGAFGFRGNDGSCFVVEANPFCVSAEKSQYPRYPREVVQSALTDKDAAAFRAILERYSSDVDKNRNAELHSRKLTDISESGRRRIIRYLMAEFPFNEEKETHISFEALNPTLLSRLSIETKDIFISRKSGCRKLHIVIKWWNDPPDLIFLKNHRFSANDYNNNSNTQSVGESLRSDVNEDDLREPLPARQPWKEGVDIKTHIETYYATEIASGTLHMGVFFRDDMGLWKEAMRLRRKRSIPAGLDLPTQTEWNDRRVANAPRRSVGQLLSFLKQIGNAETREAINLYELGRYRAARDNTVANPRRQLSPKRLKL